MGGGGTRDVHECGGLRAGKDESSPLALNSHLKHPTGDGLAAELAAKFEL